MIGNRGVYFYLTPISIATYTISSIEKGNAAFLWDSIGTRWRLI